MAPQFGDNYWRPIDSAPKDGTRVLLFIPHHGREEWIVVGYWDLEQWRFPGATHWQPLPRPPVHVHSEAGNA